MIHVFEDDDLGIKIPVFVKPGNFPGERKPLFAATVEARALRLGGGVVEANDATVVDTVNGTVFVRFIKGSFTRGSYKLQVRLTIGNQTQTIVSTLIEVFRNVDANAA